MFAPRPSAPLTPRSPAGTPRSARRLTTTNTTPSRPSSFSSSLPLAPLPPLSLRPYPSKPYADDADFAALRDDDRDAVDRAAERMRSAGSDRLRDLAGTMAEIEEGKRSVEEACKNLREAAMDMTRALKKEREDEEAAKEQEAQVAQRARKLKGDVEAIRADINEVEAKLNARRARTFTSPTLRPSNSLLTDLYTISPDATIVKLKQREAYQRQASQNGPELAFFEDKLGLKIRGRGRDQIQFKFTNIDPGNYNRPFSFDIDVSQPTYAVASVSPVGFLPPAQVIVPLLAALNRSRDFYGFVRSMRAAFKLEVRLEKMVFPPGVEGEREKDAERNDSDIGPPESTNPCGDELDSAREFSLSHTPSLRQKPVMLSYTAVDCFTDTPWSGNPAAVFVLDAGDPQFEETQILQRIAVELFLPAAAFVRPIADSTEEIPHYSIKYFSPVREIPLCGHATMGSSFVLLASHPAATSIEFETTLHGHLIAQRGMDGSISLEFPSDEGILDRVDPSGKAFKDAVSAIGVATGLKTEDVVDVAYSSRGCLIEVTRGVDLKELVVQAKKLAHLASFVVLTQLSPLGSPYDIYSRVFTAAVGADEDPVCGSAHCFIGPRWLGTSARQRLERTAFQDAATSELRCRQVSKRGGEMTVRWEPNTGRAGLSGHAVAISKGHFLI
ncbi:hypothetical protein P7C70_g5581, partial [Phenoliferia sp. Uapishka_3]